MVVVPCWAGRARDLPLQLRDEIIASAVWVVRKRAPDLINVGRCPQLLVSQDRRVGNEAPLDSLSDRKDGREASGLRLARH